MLGLLRTFYFYSIHLKDHNIFKAPFSHFFSKCENFNRSVTSLKFDAEEYIKDYLFHFQFIIGWINLRLRTKIKGLKLKQILFATKVINKMH